MTVPTSNPQTLPPQAGPGTELEKLLALLGIVSADSCGCKAFRNKMNAWGIDGCRAHRAEILDHLHKQAKKTTWQTKLAAATQALVQGLLLNPLDPLASLLDEALRRAEQVPVGEQASVPETVATDRAPPPVSP